MKNPSKNRGWKKDSPKTKKIEAWSAQGSKMSLRVSCEWRVSGPGAPAQGIERSRIGLTWSHTPMGRWPGEFVVDDSSVDPD